MYAFYITVGKMVEIIGENSSSAIVGDISIEEALKRAKSDSITYFYDYKWINENTVKLAYGKRFIFYNLSRKIVEFDITLPKESANIFYCKENKTFAYTIENNLFITDKTGKQSSTPKVQVPKKGLEVLNDLSSKANITKEKVKIDTFKAQQTDKTSKSESKSSSLT
jgi:hypothetical protein